MKLKYASGDFEKLKSKLSSIIDEDFWREINKNTFQAKLTSGAVLNYFSSTGTLQVQGKADIAAELEASIYSILNEHQEVTSYDKTSVTQILAVPDRDVDIKFLSDEYKDTEIVIGLVGAIGVEYSQVVDVITNRLSRNFSYDTKEIRVSKDVIEKLPNYEKSKVFSSEYERITYLMEQGNSARERYQNNAILSLGISKIIQGLRVGFGEKRRNAYIINSLKNPEEVKYLREIYGQGFYLVGVFGDQNDRTKYLTNELKLTDSQADSLIERDKDEKHGHGQHTSDTFALADFFVYFDESRDKLKQSLHRFLDVLFGIPTVTPLFEEFSMFMAFTSSLRSADLSRQVGAVITKNQEILSTGANDCPKFGGGLYWPYYDAEQKEITDADFGRDYKRGEDSNTIEKNIIIEDIMQKLPDGSDKEEIKKILIESRIKDLTEFGRVVHAEMEALMMCARNSVSAKGSTLFCTTFPCHNCAKHIIAAGVEKVVYIEPYPKSKALEFHSEAVKLGFKKDDEKMVNFEPFVGIGPRKFFDLFSMSIGSGRSIKRKTKDGKLAEVDPSSASLKIPLIPLSYYQREERAIEHFDNLMKL